MVPFFLRIDYTLYYRKEVLNMENKGLQKVKQWAEENKALAYIGFVAGTSAVAGSIIYMISKGEDVSEELEVVEGATENFNEVTAFLGGLNDDKDAGAWVINVVDRLKDDDDNIVEYSMEKVAEDIINGNYKEI